MNTGRMRHIVALQSKAMSTDDYGGQVETWSTFATVWAEVQPLRGRELLAAQAAQGETTVRFVLRYLATVDQADRIVWDGKIYNVRDVIDVGGMRRELHIMAATGLNEG